jgi:hypothetical protein
MVRKNRSIEHRGFERHWRRDIEEVYKMQSEKKNNNSSTIKTSMSHKNSQISLARSIGPD